MSVDTSGWIGSRRSFLRIGALGFAGLTLESLLRARRAQGASGRPEKSAILFWMAGGPSHIDTYDMKPDAPAEVRGPFRPIATNLPGLVVNEHMPRHAAIADKLAIVRSVSHDLSVHDDGSHWMQTGYPLLNAREKGQQHPCEGSVVSCVRGSNRPGVPAYVCVPEDYQTHMGFYQAAAYLGKRYDALSAYARIDRRTYGGPWFGLPEGLSAARIDDRRSLLAAFDALREHVETSDALRDADDVQQQAFELIGSREAREAFDLTKEPEFVHETYGRHAWGQYALLARRLVEAGVTFVTINLYDKDVDWWDDHYTIGKNLTKRLPPYDQAFSALVDDVHGRGLADRVLVAAYGEFGRAPRIDANAGRGHWPSAMSCVLSGGGLKTGQIVGSTTRDGAKPLDRPLSPGDLLATIYHALDIDPQRTLPDRLGRPIPLVPSGEPIRELV
ncbi:MAG: DUF1501 domain-containing protein [Planctomycetia bacterium]|nr:DUF1501 domain-containing protein [Planctomycetia bacterium]